MEVKKLFISQPMRGLSDEEILKERERIIDKVREAYDHFLHRDSSKEFEIVEIESFIKEDAPNEARFPAVWFLGRSLQFLSQADVIWFGSGWDDARGCKFEWNVVSQYMLGEIPLRESTPIDYILESEDKEVKFFPGNKTLNNSMK